MRGGRGARRGVGMRGGRRRGRGDVWVGRLFILFFYLILYDLIYLLFVT